MFSAQSLKTALRAKMQRQYTPPTCTLSVTARRLRGGSGLAGLRFELSFDDPRLPADQQKTVRGDKAQLHRLHESVAAYVRHVLAHQVDPVRASVGASDRNWAMQPTVPAFPYPHSATHLQPRGFVSHDLFLGTLATEETGTAIRLGTLQLFDLLAALDEYAADLGALPETETAGDRLPVWVSLSAGLAVTAALVFALLRLRTPQVIQQTAQSDIASEELETRELDTPAPTTSPSPTPSPTAIATPPPLSAPAEPPPTAIAPQPIPIPQGSGSNTTPPANSSTSTPETTTLPLPQSTTPNSSTTNPDPAPTVPPVAPSIPQVEFDDIPAAPRPQASIPERTPPSFSGNSSTAFDTVPQVAAVRRYFQNRWTPPQGLEQTLEYTLTLDASGALVDVAPLGQAAVQFRDRAGIPELGTALADGGQATVRLRLVLEPNGRVQTFVQ